MSDITKLTGQMQRMLQSLKRRYGHLSNKPVSVIVYYSASYAIYVHEDLNANHKVGQAKFLERPSRELRGEIATIVERAVQNGATLEQALLLGANRIKREAQLLTPVDTGNLKGSCDVMVE